MTTMHALFTRKVECKMAAAEMVAGAANPYYAAHTRRVSPAALRLPQPKLPGNSNHIARGRIRRFEILNAQPASPVSVSQHVNAAQNGAPYGDGFGVSS